MRYRSVTGDEARDRTCVSASQTGCGKVPCAGVHRLLDESNRNRAERPAGTDDGQHTLPERQ